MVNPLDDKRSSAVAHVGTLIPAVSTHNSKSVSKLQYAPVQRCLDFTNVLTGSGCFCDSLLCTMSSVSPDSPEQSGLPQNRWND